MYRLRTQNGKKDPEVRWSLPDKVFFACGACHILAYAFLKAYPSEDFRPVWIRPKNGFSGNHIVVVHQQRAFDYHGYSDWSTLMEHFRRRANQWWPGWNAELIELPEDALVSNSESRKYDGLWLREPSQFLHNAMPRAQAYLRKFPAPQTNQPQQSSRGNS